MSNTISSLPTNISALLDVQAEKPKSYNQRFDRVRELISKKEESRVIQIEIANMVLIGVKCITLLDTDEILWYNQEKGIWERGAENIIRQICHKVDDTLSTHSINEIIDKIRRMTYKGRTILNPQRYLGLVNGVWDLKNYELLPHKPEYYLTRAIPVEYNHTKDCPLVKKFLKEVVAEENIRLLEEAVGFCLEPTYSYHRAFLLLGPTHTGKSTFLNLLKAFLGGENVASITLQQITHSDFYTKRLFGKMANISPDLPNKAIYSTGIFKALTGEDTITANVKHKEPIQFINTAKIFFSANEIPPSEYDDSDAYYIRWIIIDFVNQFIDNANEDLLINLTTSDELSGLLNLALKSLLRLKERGRFEERIDTEQKTTAYILGSNVEKAFVYNKCKVEAGAWIEKNILYEAYKKYCKEGGREPKAQNSFTTQLRRWAKNVEGRQKRINGVRVPVYKGITLLEEIEDG